MNFQMRNCIFPSDKYNDDYVNDMIKAIKEKRGYSWVRIGDGELVFFQQEYIKPIKEILKSVGWSHNTNYCGAKIPNIELRNRMIESARNADLVGVFQGDPPMLEIFEKIQIKPKSICYAFDNVFLPMNAYFVNNILLKNRLFIVGMNSSTYRQKFEEILGANVVGTATIQNYDEIEQCMDKMCQYDYDVALVSAGVNANVICYEMSKKLNRVFLDMGHAWDNALHPPPKYTEYWLIPAWKHDKYFKVNERVIYNDGLYQNTSGEMLCSCPEGDERWVLVENLKENIQ